LERTFQILVFVFGSTFHGRISTFFKVLRRDLTKTKGEEDPKRMEFGPKPGEIPKKKDLANKYISIQRGGGETQEMHHFYFILVVN